MKHRVSRLIVVALLAAAVFSPLGLHPAQHAQAGGSCYMCPSSIIPPPPTVTNS